eukprot:1180903-Prorocentrum_minimum.AAC.1
MQTFPVEIANPFPADCEFAITLLQDMVKDEPKPAPEKKTRGGGSEKKKEKKKPKAPVDLEEEPVAYPNAFGLDRRTLRLKEGDRQRPFPVYTLCMPCVYPVYAPCMPRVYPMYTLCIPCARSAPGSGVGRGTRGAAHFRVFGGRSKAECRYSRRSASRSSDRAPLGSSVGFRSPVWKTKWTVLWTPPPRASEARACACAPFLSFCLRCLLASAHSSGPLWGCRCICYAVGDGDFPAVQPGQAPRAHPAGLGRLWRVCVRGDRGGAAAPHHAQLQAAGGEPARAHHEGGAPAVRQHHAGAGTHHPTDDEVPVRTRARSRSTDV